MYRKTASRRGPPEKLRGIITAIPRNCQTGGVIPAARQCGGVEIAVPAIIVLTL
jgi:hypothetical protein